MSYPLAPSFPTTATIYRPSRTASSLLLFLPGNPGLITYYTHYFDLLSRHLPHTTILGASHAGFTPSAHNTYYPLAVQVSLKLQLLRWFVAREGVKKVVLAGHSMGAWLGMEMLKELAGEEGVEIVGMVGLFPTVIEIAESKAGRMMGVS
jgi:pimeloyl-ACP methyl ester carboxylesterase